MQAKRGYYSLVQFCPDASRQEAVNVGVVLFCPDVDFLAARLSHNNRRAEKLVGRRNLENKALSAAKRAIEERLVVDRTSFKDISDLEHFINTRANWLRLTPARPVKVFQPAQDLQNLYEELVGRLAGEAKQRDESEWYAPLSEAFAQLHAEGRARLDLKVEIPVAGISVAVPYAYRNGAVNYVKPHHFPSAEVPAVNAAMRLAMEGDLLQRYAPGNGQSARFIVVSAFDDRVDSNLACRVDKLLEVYGVENIERDQLEEFIQRIMQEAH